MIIIAVISLVESLLSLLGAVYLCISCFGGWRNISHQDTIRSILFHVGVADVLAAATWISTQVVALGFASETWVRCAVASISGLSAFMAMSIWTVLLAVHVHGALALQRRPRPLGCVHHLVGWLLPVVLTALMLPGHFETCQVHATGPPGPLEQLNADIFTLVFGGLPLITSACLATYHVRICRHYRKISTLALPAEAESGSGPTSPLSPQTPGVATRLDRRLLSYILAYAACQLPALPALMDDLGNTYSGNSTAINPLASNDDRAYITRQETDPLVAMRVLANSGQGLINALVYAHHAHHLGPCGRLWLRMRDRLSESEW